MGSAGRETAAIRRPTRLTIVPDDPPAEAAVASEPRTRRGQLLAVCGLCGGAGTSTLAYLVGVAVTRSQPGRVLVADTGGPGGGLADYAGVQAPRSLVEVAEQVAAGLPTRRLYATTADGLRVLATGPRFAPGCAPDGVQVILDHARSAHALTIIDCGTLTREAEQLALAKASHVAWVLPATPSGLRRATRVLEAVNPSVNPYLLGRELVIARRDEREPKAAINDLKRIAAARHAPLILIPHLPDLATGKTADALQAAQVSLQAIQSELQR